MPLPAARHETIILHVLLIALTRWIPLPLLDGLVADYFRRRLIRALAREHGALLDAPGVHALGDEGFGCISGCVWGCLLFPLRFVLGIFWLLFRLKRFIDSASTQYHRARLIDRLLQERRLTPEGPLDPRRAATALDELCTSHHTGPVEGAFRTVLKQRTGVLRSAAGLLTRGLRRLAGRRNDPEGPEFTAAAESAEAAAEPLLRTLVSPLRAALDAIPEQHMDALYQKLLERLSRPA